MFIPPTDLSFFEYKYHDRGKGYDVYKLNASRLSEDECHMFFPVQVSEELRIATALEYITFNPANKKMNDKFNINPVKCGDIEVFCVVFLRNLKMFVNQQLRFLE